MTLEISTTQLELLIERAAELGAKIALIKTGAIKPYLTKSQTFRKYGRSNVEQWINSGLITPRKDGGHSAAWRIDRIEVEFISNSIDYHLFLSLLQKIVQV